MKLLLTIYLVKRISERTFEQVKFHSVVFEFRDDGGHVFQYENSELEKNSTRISNADTFPQLGILLKNRPFTNRRIDEEKPTATS